MTNFKINWKQAYLDMEATKSIFPSGTSLKTNFDAFKWIAEEIEIPLKTSYAFASASFSPTLTKKFQRINLYLSENTDSGERTRKVEEKIWSHKPEEKK